MGLAAIGYTLGDKELIKYAVDDPDNPRDVIEMINGAVMMPGNIPFWKDPDPNPIAEAGEIYDRYRSRKGT